MNIQIYMLKRTFDVQKAERFFKERRVPYHLVDLSRHRLGARELELFSSRDGMDSLLDRSSPKVKEHPAAYCGDEKLLKDYFMQDPSLMRLPIIRNDRQFTIGADEKTWAAWIKQSL